VPRSKERHFAEEKKQCRGGISFHCLHHEHDRSTVYRCQKCRTYMGCSRCAQIPQELVCLKCNDWALPEGEREHGKMMYMDKTALKKKVAELVKSVS